MLGRSCAKSSPRHVAEDIRAALSAANEITGKSASENLVQFGAFVVENSINVEKDCFFLSESNL